MTKMEIDLTPEQIEKVEILKANGISIGEAIDMLFEIKEKALSDIETFDDSKSVCLQSLMTKCLMLMRNQNYWMKTIGKVKKPMN